MYFLLPFLKFDIRYNNIQGSAIVISESIVEKCPIQVAQHRVRFLIVLQNSIEMQNLKQREMLQ